MSATKEIGTEMTKLASHPGNCTVCGQNYDYYCCYNFFVSLCKGKGTHTRIYRA